MIGRLRGRVIESEPDGALVIDVGGVGYEAVSPLGTLGRAETEADGAVVLHIHTHVREDALELFAFATPAERTAFRTLISISKVGPKMALNVLSAVTVDDLAEMVESGQSARLTRIPGVGKKTADRMVLELKGKLHPTGRRGARLPARLPVAPDSGNGAVLRDALVRMGFKPAEAERAVSQLTGLDRPLGELVREALAVLSP